MGTIIKFVINMEGLDADLDQIQNRLAFTPAVLPNASPLASDDGFGGISSSLAMSSTIYHYVIGVAAAFIFVVIVVVVIAIYHPPSP